MKECRNEAIGDVGEKGIIRGREDGWGWGLWV